ncbi:MULTISPECIES: YqaJ viral recombinase family nuclease [Lysinibacillus]|uniref:YqaJ viral recombinase family nuclease n=1 Tax=Lysinibacillus TaxID=400634 RepID=UPI00056635CE|nr:MULTISPECIES: YqaJ viral recombinase family protein [Lysinibacillus]QTB21611.1 YqaJ viral recombinase family protein [Lysinibacillus sphaericus]SCX52211.1 putative phage-type endonuclease [Lysinibacillus fusiformis]SDB27582.1 putative phage-type endonuclease [Lysinibacillus fusiformis]SFI21507.1 putative phage-type endonuclease [Lysinibacillus fusiformis]SFS81749.1 putative phage-type endonuclease [Lysinibacillus fusiformis]
MVLAKITTADMSRDEWLDARRAGIGGSDVGAIMGFNQYKSAYQVFLEKTGQYHEEVDNDAVYFGNALEDFVAQEFAKRTGKKVRRLNKMLVHPEHDFMLANLDRVVVGERAVLECKTASEYVKEAWEGEEIPASYLCQVHHYLAVTGFEKAYIAVLVGGNKFIWKEIERDEEFIQILIDREKDFWENHVLKDVAPPVDGSDATNDLIKKMYPQDDGTAIMLTKDDDLLLDAIDSISSEIKALEQQKKEYENQLKLKLENATEGHSQRHKVTFKTVVSNRVDSKRLKVEVPDIYDKFIKPSSSRRLTIKKLEA